MTLQTSVQSRVGSHGSFAVCWLQSIEALGYFTLAALVYSDQLCPNAAALRHAGCFHDASFETLDS